MAAPILTYERYTERHLGRLTEDQFNSVIDRATERLVYLTGEEIEERHASRWLDACGVLCDRVFAGKSANVTSEHVGETTLSYDAATSGATDYDTVRPYLGPTGLLFQGLR